MPLGFVREVVVCVSGYPEAAPCSAGSGPAVVSSYVLDPAAAGVLDVIAAPLNVGQSLSFWAVSFGGVLILWVSAHIMRRLRSIVV